MLPTASIFLDFSLPNAATWFYFALLLAVAVFVRFSRPLSLRNWDVVAMFLLVPGLLLRQEATAAPVAEAGKLPAPTSEEVAAKAPPSSTLWLAYLWLLCGSAYFFARCLLDLSLVRRPALHPNLNLPGLVWLGLALFLCLVVASLVRPTPGGADLAGIVWTRRCIAIACHASIVTALVWIGCRHFQDGHTGVALGAFYFLLPYTAAAFDQVHQLVPMAFVLWAVVFWNRPTIAGLLLGLAAGSIYFPAFLFPAWLSFYWRRGAGRFATAFALAAALGLAITGAVYWYGGPVADELQASINVFDWPQWKLPLTEGFWTGVHWAYRIPLFIAYLAFLVGTLFWPAPKNLGHLLALSAAILVGTQFWFADRGGLHVLWYLPLMLLVIFRPNLADRYPTPIDPENDWVRRLRERVMRFIHRSVKAPDPAVPVQPSL